MSSPSYNKNKLIAGINVMSSNAIRKYPIIGIAFLAMCITGTSVSELATKRFTPIGGVINPIARFTIMIKPSKKNVK